MTDLGTFGDVTATLGDDHVVTLEIHRPPHNFFDKNLIASLADAMEAIDADPRARAVVLCAEGKNFCAGANFHAEDRGIEGPKGRHLYDEAVRLFRTRTPVVAAVQGAAVGGGLGLALWPDFRVSTAASRWSANFARLGIHHGFGLSATLPKLVGQQHAMDMFYTGRRVKGEEALAMGLCDKIVGDAELRPTAHAWALEIATSAPLAVDSIRETLRGGLADEIRSATDREKAEQDRLFKTADHREGVAAMTDRRTPQFTGS